MTQELSCGECRDNLLEFTAGVLAEPVREAVEQHLASCDDCQRERAFWEALGGGMRERRRRVPIDGGEARGWALLSAAHAAERASVGTKGVHAMETFEHEAGGATDTVGVAGTMEDIVPLEAGAEGGGRSTTAPRRRGLRLWQAAMPAVAALLLVALGVALFGPLRPGQQRGQQQQRATCSANQISAAEIPVHFDAGWGEAAFRVTDFKMVSPDEGWMIGSDYSPLQPGEAQHAVIWHYALCRWTPVTEPTPHLPLHSLTMVSPTEGWALGENSTPGSHEQFVALHYAQGQWKVDTLPISPTLPGMETGENTAEHLSMLSPTEGWLITRNRMVSDPTSGSRPLDIFHGSNGHWEKVTIPGTIVDDADVVPVAPDEAWIIVYEPGASVSLVHYKNGTIGDTYSLPMHVRIDGSIAGSIAVNSPHDLWLSGYLRINQVDYADFRFLLHYDGTGWKKLPLADAQGLASASGMSVFSANDGFAFLVGVNGGQHVLNCGGVVPSADDGDQPPVSGALRLTSSGWQRTSWGLSDVGCIRTVQRAGVDDYWALAQHRVFDAATATYVQHAVLLHYAEGQWRMYGDSGDSVQS